MKYQPHRKIGGFHGVEFPFCKPKGESVWNHFIKGGCQLIEQHNARGVFSSILSIAKPRRIWYPAYLCSSMLLEKFSSATKFYPVGSTLKPDVNWLAENLKKGDAVIAIDFFGVSPDNDFHKLASSRSDILWLEDCAQAIEPGKHWGDWVIYSPRKLFGVAEGGLGVCRNIQKKLELPFKKKPIDFQLLLEKLNPIYHRFENQNEELNDIWYQKFLDTENSPYSHELDTMDWSISRLTREILQAIDVEVVIDKRKNNAMQLYNALPTEIKFWQTLPAAALLGYPLILDERDRIASQLIESGVFCPVHWRNLPSSEIVFKAEHNLSQQILMLPCDQRYGSEDMQRIIDLLISLL